MKNYRRIAYIMLLIAVTAVLAACGGGAAEATEDPEVPAGDGEELTFLAPPCEEAYQFIISGEGMEIPEAMPAELITFCITNNATEVSTFGFEGPTLPDRFEIKVPPGGDELFIDITMKPGDHTFYYQLDSMSAPEEFTLTVSE